jgi:hypothetical protein
VIARKHWTPAQAKAAQRRFEARGGKGCDPAGPLFQWCALHTLDALEDSYAKGDEGALLAAVRECANHDVVLPPWVAREFIRRYDQVLTCRVASWDDAFGRPLPKGRSLAAARKRRDKRFAVVMEVRKRRKRGSPVDVGLFQEVGAALAISGSTARDLYYDTLKRWPLLAETFKR